MVVSVLKFIPLRLVPIACSITLASASAENRGTFWPGAARPPMSITTREAVCDSVPVELRELTGAGLTIRLDPVGGWEYTNAASERFSIMLQQHANPEVHLGFAIFRSGEFLRDLELPHWTAYVEGLLARYGSALLEVKQAGNMDGSDGMFVFGRPYREVTYSVSDASSGTTQGHREVFVMLGRQLLVIAIEGEPEIVAALDTSFQRFIARLEWIADT